MVYIVRFNWIIRMVFIKKIAAVAKTSYKVFLSNYICVCSKNNYCLHEFYHCDLSQGIGCSCKDSESAPEQST